MAQVKIYSTGSSYCGTVTSVTATSPMSSTEEQRRIAESVISKEKFFLTYVMCDIETLIKRDTKGLYQKYLRGEVKNMVGFDLPYEKPNCEQVCVDTQESSVEKCATKIIDKWLDFRFNL